MLSWERAPAIFCVRSPKTTPCNVYFLSLTGSTHFLVTFVCLKGQKNFIKKSNQSRGQYLVYNYDRFARKYLPCLGQTNGKLYPLFRTERTKTIHYPAAYPRIDHIRESPHPRSEVSIVCCYIYILICLFVFFRSNVTIVVSFRH